MTRRQRHNRVLIGFTIVFLAVCGYLMLVPRDLRGLLIACGAYAGFVLLYSLACWLEVPRQLRRRPDRPADFRRIRLGEITDKATRFLAEAPIARDEVFGGVRHQLFRVERAYAEGTWRCEVEVADDRILAVATSYESIESPVMDRGDQVGMGRFLSDPG